ncbi:MAG: TraR/DksA C4-type zinc finger protein [Armatimonadota bacterium]|nr:TraR/DksA C4-type zinc finger protein [Armatimonadota bacterium]MDR5696865.1 TraR/DksA C4-type zinc finger protein [Armatimonadota bacterium]
MTKKATKTKRRAVKTPARQKAGKRSAGKTQPATRVRKPAAKPAPGVSRKTAPESSPVSLPARRSPMPARAVRPPADIPLLAQTPRMDLPSPTVARVAAGARRVARAVERQKVRGITKRDYPAFRRLLLSERQRLVQELETMGERLQQVEEVGVVEASSEDDYGDVATETFEREKGFALESSVQGMLRMVEDALRKIDVGKYGICERCGNPIDVERLRALPFASLCIRCKTEEEREKNQVNSGR